MTSSQKSHAHNAVFKRHKFNATKMARERGADILQCLFNLISHETRLQKTTKETNVAKVSSIPLRSFVTFVTFVRLCYLFKQNFSTTPFTNPQSTFLKNVSMYALRAVAKSKKYACSYTSIIKSATIFHTPP